MKKVALVILAVSIVAGVIIFYACSSSSSNNKCGVGGFQCLNGNAYNCVGGSWVIDDCSARVGVQCELFNYGARCTPITTPDSGTSQCGIGGFLCVNNKAYNCVNGAWVINDCSTVVGSVCVMDNTGAKCGPFVGPDGGTVECGMGGFKCDGTKACNCNASYTWVCEDCAATIGTMCMLSNEGASCEAI